MSDAKLSGVPEMTVDRIIDSLSDAYTALIKHKRPVWLMPSVMLWGPPGAGKSQAVRQIAGESKRTRASGWTLPTSACCCSTR